jgi:hypothetical protein
MARKKKSREPRLSILDKERENHLLQTADSSDPIGMYGNTDIQARAIGIVRGEKQRWEVATAFVTDRVSFKMRQLIRIFRKNYYGIFDVPIDQYTNLEKTWYPLTEINVEAVMKNIDLDQKDINFRARTSEGAEITDVTRAAVKNKLSTIYFGQKLDDFERMMAIDGTAVWKTYEERGKLIIKQVDLLNIYIDPTTPSIQEAYRFTERTLMFPEEIIGMNGWINTEGIDQNVIEGLPRTDPYWMNRSSQVNSNVKLIDVYEMWGQIPLSLITGNWNDNNVEVAGHIVVSGIDSPGKERAHVIERNTKVDKEGNSLKPYEECWYTRVPNRWYGRGIAEKLLTLQIYANIVFNVRINRSRVSQLGLFKMKKGAGITPQMLARLPSNGVVVLNNLEDLEQMVVQEVGESSYKDEEVINDISERLTNAFQVATGENLPASTSATEASLQTASVKSGFALVKDALGGFLERWMDRHALKIIAKELTAGEIVRITSDEDTFGELVERVAHFKAMEALDKSFEEGYLPSPQEIQQEIEHVKEKMRKGDMFVKLVRDIIADELETKMYVTNEEMDVTITIQNLLEMMKVAPQYSDQIIKQTVDLMGLSPFKNPPPPMPQGAPIPAGTPQGAPQNQGQQMQNIAQNAMTLH